VRRGGAGWVPGGSNELTFTVPERVNNKQNKTVSCYFNCSLTTNK
jgi:hypothetical protein